MTKKIKTICGRTNIVGVIASKEDLIKAKKYERFVDMFEWRLDRLYDYPTSAFYDWIRGKLFSLHKPIILTVRSAKERGGRADWSTGLREVLYIQNLDVAAMVDIEADSLDDMVSIKYHLGYYHIGLIVSYHHFGPPPSLSKLERASSLCSKFGGDILKLAFEARSQDQFAKCFGYVTRIQNRSSVPVAAMAMGRFGKISRLLFGSSGSPLVYGYLDKAAVSGQWHVSELRNMLEQLKL